MKRRGSKYRDQSDFFRQTLDVTYEGLQIFSFDWVYLYLNQAAALHGNSSVDELLGSSLLEYFPGIEKTPVFAKMHNVMSKRIPDNFENYFEYSDRNGCWFELFIEPHPAGILVRTVDITKRKDFESQYYQAQKMEMIGQLAGGIAHDFNNKLAVMLMYCELALQQEGASEKLQRYLRNIYESIDESSDLIQKLLAFSRRQVMDLKVIDLNYMLKSHLQKVEGVLEDNIKVEKNFEEGIGYIKVDPVQMGQVVLNLILNSRDALPEGGRMTIGTSLVEGAKWSVPHICLSVHDNGVGIPEDIQKEIFGPFFTTKKHGKGTGLGLASVDGIVKQSHGHIEVESTEGVGTTFKVYFPRVQEELLLDDNESKEAEAVFKGSEFVLVVDDSESLGEGLVEALGNLGYQTKLIHRPRQALEFFDLNKDKIDLVLTDLMMPEFNGDELVRGILSKKSDVKVIYTSGFAGSDESERKELSESCVFIQKPMTRKVLLSTLRGVLDGKITKGLY